MPKASLLLAASGLVYIAAAVALLFAPEELLRFAGVAPSTLDMALLQVLGSALFGFGLLDWMQRYSRIGGIYSRPLVMANLAHAASAALLLGHIAVRTPSAPLLAATAAYGCIAIGFGVRLFVSPAAG